MAVPFQGDKRIHAKNPYNRTTANITDSTGLENGKNIYQQLLQRKQKIQNRFSRTPVFRTKTDAEPLRDFLQCDWKLSTIQLPKKKEFNKQGKKLILVEHFSQTSKDQHGVKRKKKHTTKTEQHTKEIMTSQYKTKKKNLDEE